MLLSKYIYFYLNTKKNNVVIRKFTYKNFSLIVKIKTIHTTNFEFCTYYDVIIKNLDVECFKN